MTTEYVTTGAPMPCPTCGIAAALPLVVGVSAVGWPFSFASRPERDLTDEASWRAYLVGRTIHDEYGRTVPGDDFWRMVDSKRHLRGAP